MFMLSFWRLQLLFVVFILNVVLPCLVKQINGIEIEFDLRRAILDYKHEDALKDAYERRAQIILRLNANENTQGNNSITFLDDSRSYSSLSNTRLHEFNINNSNATTDTRRHSSRKIESKEFGRDQRSGPERHKESIKGFWYTVFLNSRQLSDVIQEHDMDALSYLIDVSSMTDITNLKSYKAFSFILGFHFSSNPYFHNQVLTKEYFVEIKVDKDNPLQYYGPRICRSVGCPINWKADMDLTKRIPPRRPPRKSVSQLISSSPLTTSTPTTTYSHKNNDNNADKCHQFKVKEWVLSGGKDTFFNYFSFPELPDGISLDADDEALVDKDFQLGWHIKDDLIPQALFYFLGDVPDSEEDDASETSSSSSVGGSGSSCDSSLSSSGSSPDCLKKCRCGRLNNGRKCLERPE